MPNGDKNRKCPVKNDNLRTEHFIGSKVFNSSACDLTISLHPSVFHQLYKLLSI